VPRSHRQRAILRRFIQVYCRRTHATTGGLCAACQDLLAYAEDRLDHCPHDPRPACRRCPTHCYRPEYRARIREVMRSSGMYFVRRGRLDWLLRYFLA
jgi:hypothetical protein